jgi:hypothetical protein
MNLRFAAHSIRIRVSADEFEALRAGKALGLDVPLPRGHVFRAKLSKTNTPEWQFDSDPTGLWFSIPHTELDTLAMGLPAREGVAHVFSTQQGELQISLEVDVKGAARQS